MKLKSGLTSLGVDLPSTSSALGHKHHENCVNPANPDYKPFKWLTPEAARVADQAATATPDGWDNVR